MVPRERGLKMCWFSGGELPGSTPCPLSFPPRSRLFLVSVPIFSANTVRVKNLLAGGLKVQPVENGLVVANVVERPELRRVEKTAAADAVNGQEVAKLRIAKTKSYTASG